MAAAAAAAWFAGRRMMTTLINVDSIVTTAIDRRHRLWLGREGEHGEDSKADHFSCVSSVFAETLSTNWTAAGHRRL